MVSNNTYSHRLFQEARISVDHCLRLNWANLGKLTYVCLVILFQLIKAKQ